MRAAALAEEIPRARRMKAPALTDAKLAACHVQGAL
jgi:hypothetical protein